MRNDVIRSRICDINVPKHNPYSAYKEEERELHKAWEEGYNTAEKMIKEEAKKICQYTKLEG